MPIYVNRSSQGSAIIGKPIQQIVSYRIGYLCNSKFTSSSESIEFFYLVDITLSDPNLHQIRPLDKESIW
jgi:hypothetical protein